MLHIHSQKRNFYKFKIGGGPHFNYRTQVTTFGIFISIRNKTVRTGLTEILGTLWRYLF